MSKNTNTNSSPKGGGREGAFYYYLKDEGLKESTIDGHIKDIERFSRWVKANELSDIARLNYNELLSYVHYLKQQTLAITTVNTRIRSIQKYYEHLKQEGQIEINPAKRLFIKGAVKKVIYNPLSYIELESLYIHYNQYLEQKQTREEKHKRADERNKIIVGLMIWQGVNSGEMKRLETTHINLQNGSIYIPSNARSQSRELKLETAQIIPLHNYLNSLPPSQTKLFAVGIDDTMTRIVEELKGINPQVKNAAHIRASVILHWLKMYDKRKVQYMAGHKWISSTEKYEVQELTGLTDLLTKHHPFS